MGIFHFIDEITKAVCPASSILSDPQINHGRMVFIHAFRIGKLIKSASVPLHMKGACTEAQHSDIEPVYDGIWK
jgi:hypothetical protein